MMTSTILRDGHQVNPRTLTAEALDTAMLADITLHLSLLDTVVGFTTPVSIPNGERARMGPMRYSLRARV